MIFEVLERENIIYHLYNHITVPVGDLGMHIFSISTKRKPWRIIRD